VIETRTRSTRPVDPELLRRSRPVRRQLAICVVLGIATAVAIVGQAWWLAWVLADGFAGVGLGPLWWPLTGVAVAIVARAALGWAPRVGLDEGFRRLRTADPCQAAPWPPPGPAPQRPVTASS